MGGMVAQTLTITHPHRVRSLTSIMSHSGERTDAFAHPRALRVLLGPAPRSVEQAMDNAEKFYRTVGSTGFELDVDGARERAGRAYQRCFYPKGFVRQLAAMEVQAQSNFLLMAQRFNGCMKKELKRKR